MRDFQRLIKNIIALTLIAGVVFLVIWYFTSDDELTIDPTPIEIQSVKKITELGTVSYKDEVVVDTIVINKIGYDYYDPRTIIDKYYRGVDKRLTMIFQGEVRVGFNLAKDDFEMKKNQDTVWVTLPQPEILEVIVTPSKTEIFQEQGSWSEGAKRRLEQRAFAKLEDNTKNLNLYDQSKNNCERLFKKLIPNKTVIVEYH